VAAVSDILTPEQVRECLRELRLVDTDDMESLRRMDIERAIPATCEALRARADEAEARVAELEATLWNIRREAREHAETTTGCRQLERLISGMVIAALSAAPPEEDGE